jgi:hypothetical protein
MAPYVVAYLAAIVAANLLVAAFGPAIAVVNAFLFIGLDLTCRDRLHDAWQGRSLWPRMLVLIAAGGVISYALNANAAQIAIASTVAFATASLADAGVYALFHERAWFQRVNLSNTAGAAVDSVVFPTIAFGGLDPVLTLALFAAKVAGGFVWSVILVVPLRRRPA